MRPDRFAVILLLSFAAAASAGQRPLVAVVSGERSGSKVSEEDAKGARLFMDIVASALDATGLAYDKLRAEQVSAGGLKAYKVAIFPYSSVWPEDDLAAIEDYVHAGGKIMLFYNVPRRLHDRAAET